VELGRIDTDDGTLDTSMKLSNDHQERTILLMPFLIRPDELATGVSELVIRFNPLRQCRQLRSREFGQRV